ncbi:hypothetical protein FGO68_gene6006 [Halteria grandinella]|uniref:Uncharacterized protein n=1 Tax=Halteria grandinella TaxID=5974 RepID=A0A8J8SZ10_HALGN|nr:hypothetical protein FGO68_gene6006 [Halteria grandinella]
MNHSRPLGKGYDPIAMQEALLHLRSLTLTLFTSPLIKFPRASLPVFSTLLAASARYSLSTLPTTMTSTQLSLPQPTDVPLTPSYPYFATLTLTYTLFLCTLI